MIEAELPDGTVLEFPPGTSPDVVQRAVKSHLGVKDTSTLDSIKQGAGNLLAGAVRGAGSIGATLLAPIDMAKDAIDGKGLSLESNRQRRQEIDNGLRLMGADTDSALYGAGKLAGEIAGTAGAGGILANGLTKVAPMIANAAPTVSNALTKLAPAIESGGLSLGNAATGSVAKNLALRTTGGAIQGAATAGLADPSNVAEGAVIGGALPGAVLSAGLLGKGIKNATASTVKNILGTTTGAGAEAIGTAYQAGKSGSREFLENMRSEVPVDDVLNKAKDALTQMRLDRGQAYRNGMASVSGDKSVISFAPIENAMNQIKSMGTYKGQIINKNASGTVDELADLVNQWKSLDPAEYHTPEGLDALKKAIGDVRDSLQHGSPARVAADKVYNAVKGEIVSQAPGYAKVMKDYEEASAVIKEIERTLSLNPTASVDTKMRKLQSLMRNNVNTNYGNRLDLARQLEQQGGQSILNDVAGQALNSWTPRGLQALGAGVSLASAIPSGGATLATLPLQSPRLVGEMAYGLGSASRGVSQAADLTGQKLARLLSQGNAPQLRNEELAALLAATPVLAATQR